MDRAEFLRQLREFIQIPELYEHKINGINHGLTPNFGAIKDEHTVLSIGMDGMAPEEHTRAMRMLETAYLNKLVKIYNHPTVSYTTMHELARIITHKYYDIKRRYGESPTLLQIYKKCPPALKRELPKPEPKIIETRPAPPQEPRKNWKQVNRMRKPK